MPYPFRLDLRPSGRIQTLMFAMHGIATSALSFLAPSFVYAVAFAVIVLVALLLGWRRWRGQVTRSLLLRDDGCFELADGGRARVLPSTTDFGWALWLHWEDEQGRRGALMLAPDAMAVDDWRRLRTWLWHKGARGA
jgi:hypothetical protein